MRMVLHFLWKDLRRNWVELGLYLLMCVGMAWSQAHPGSWIWLRQRELFPIVLFGLWFFIVVRVVQGECLVGDREFWSTRPYRWPHLMIEKAAFLVICLDLPFLIVHLYLLHHAGFPLSPSLLYGLVFLHLMFVFFFTFPAAVLASITRSLVEWLLTIAGLLIILMVISWFPWDELPNTLAEQEEIGTWIAAAVAVPALAFALLWQYARRRVWPARLAAGVACLFIPIAVLLTHASFVRSLAYPLAGNGTPLRVTINDAGSPGSREFRRFDVPLVNETNIIIPIVLGSADPDTSIAIDGMRVTLNGDGGWHWQSEWLNASTQMSNEAMTSALMFAMPTAMAEHLESVHANASVEYAFRSYRLGRVQRINTAQRRFTIEGAGFCDWENREFRQLKFSGMQCNAPLRMPAVMVSQMESGHDTCIKDEGEPPIPAGHHSTIVEYGTEGMSAEFNPEPVRTFTLAFGGWNPPVPSVTNPKKFRTAHLCQGSPLSVRTGVLEGKMRAAFDLGPIGVENKSKPEPDPQDKTEYFDPSVDRGSRNTVTSCHSRTRNVTPVEPAWGWRRSR
jgi:hypothetical protein